MGDIGAALTDMWRSVLLFLPKAIAFLAILVVGLIIAAVVRKIVDRVLERVGFDRAVERGGVGRVLARSRYDASDILARLAYYALVLLTLQLAFGVWGPNPVSDLITAVVAWLPKAFVAILIVVVAAAIASAVKDLIGGALGGLSYGRFLANLASWFIIGLGAIAALNQVGIATTVTTPVLIAALATVAGILIVGVGGGLVRPMSARWDGWLERAEAESQVIKERAQAYAAGRDDMSRQLADRSMADRTEVIPRSDETPAMAGAPATAFEATTPGTTAQTGYGGATTGQTAFEPGATAPADDATATSGQTYQSDNATKGSPAASPVDETQRINPKGASEG
jgi:mechanosensitive ion channel-like protein